MNTHYKIDDDNIIEYLLKILTSIIESKDYSYNVFMKTCIDNIIMKKNHKYHSNIVKFKIKLDRILMSCNIEDNNDVYAIDNLMIDYMIYLLIKNYDDVYIIDDIIDVIGSIHNYVKKQMKRKIINLGIKYNRMNNRNKNVFNDDIYKNVFNNLKSKDGHKFQNI